MSKREMHPVWVSPTPAQIEGIQGDCLASPVSKVDVTALPDTLNDPTLVAEINCARYPDGNVIEIPFPLMDAADTNREQTQLGVDSTQIALYALCSTCELHSRIR